MSVQLALNVSRTVLMAVLPLFLAGCPDNNGTATDTFDRKAMLTEMASKIIVPGYAAMSASNAELLAKTNQFTQAPSQTTLDAVRLAWDSAAMRWQDVVTFDFGPAEGLYGNLSMNVGTFPANASRIEALIAAGDTALQNFERDTRGLYGIEYLLYSADAAAVVAAFSGPSGADRCAYLRSIVRRMEQEVDTVHAQWVGGYAENFASRNGTDAGSGTSQLFNAMNMAFELVKNYKLGLPLGLRAGQSGPEPTKVEAFYSHLSVSLSQRQFNAVMRVWEGTTTSDESIPGFAEYLEHVPNGERLIADTRAQHQAVLTAGAAVSTSVPLSEQVVSNPSPATAWHTEMQKLTRYLKSELSSLTGLAITYASGDGD